MLNDFEFHGICIFIYVNKNNSLTTKWENNAKKNDKILLFHCRINERSGM